MRAFPNTLVGIDVRAVLPTVSVPTPSSMPEMTLLSRSTMAGG